MSNLLTLPIFKDQRGSLGVIESNLLPFDIKRVYFLCEPSGDVRGGHRHKATIQAMVCAQGSCEVICQNAEEVKAYRLDSPDMCLIIAPEDWHTYRPLTPDTVIMVLASEHYNSNDYIDEAY
ncbi:MAG: WxcM-like protein [Gammaproteobacteria bacterium]|jgi:dTDP-4-dehydrorhamnose 3,5-epimerase-like enzyme|nr:WxcM-like protein [Gammaproteobacteria bacterium]